MIRVSLAMVKQAARYRNDVRSNATSPRGIALLPTATLPEIVKTRARAADASDALLVIAPMPSEKELFRQLPESERWQELNARTPPRAGTVRTTVLSNRRQTLAVVG